MILIQGMRRSGTTFLLDVLTADPAFSPYYEPLAAAKKTAVGGGSRIRKVDYFDQIRDVRKGFGEFEELTDLDVLNHGGPRAPELEFGPDLPAVVIRYLRHIERSSVGTPVLKFVRAAHKLAVLAHEFPEARLLLIVRNPRSVVSSFLLGKGKKNRGNLASANRFFGACTMQKGERVYAQGLCKHLDRSTIGNGTDVELLLALWRDTVHAMTTGQLAFGERAFLVRHEDILASPEQTMHVVYERLGQRRPPAVVLDWLQGHVMSAPVCVAPQDERWNALIDRVGLTPLLEQLSYESTEGFTDALQ